MGTFGNITIATVAQLQDESTSQSPAMPPRWFRSIPPERLGVSGEYDHNGLANRVRQHFQQVMGPKSVAHLSVMQRGRVVILHGQVESRQLLHQLVNLAHQVEGTADVEVRSVICGRS